MTAADRPQKDPTPEQILDAFSPPARRCLRAMAGTPDAAVRWYNGLSDVRAALKIGVEVMETSAREEAQANGGRPTHTSNVKMMAASHALATTTAIECCMSIIERLCGPHMTLKVKVTDEGAGPPENGANPRFRPMDLD